MYPAPAISNFSKPGTGPIPATISSAILRGALRSLGEFECDGERVLSEFDFGGLLDDYVDVIKAIGALEKCTHRFG